MFYILLLKQDNIKKVRMNKLPEFGVDDKKEYELKII